MLKDIALPMGATDVTPNDKLHMFSRLMIDAAYLFDDLSEDIIDRNMCTPHCPCFVQETGLDPRVPGHEAMIRFHSVNEPYLNMRNRTWDNISRGDNTYIPFEWTTNIDVGFTNFEQCFNKHFREGMS